MRLIQFLVTRSRRNFFMAVPLGFVSGALNASLLTLVNMAIWHQPYRAGAILAAFVVLCIAAPLVRVSSELLVIRLGQSAVLALRTELSRQVLGVPLRTLEQFGLHRILSVMTDDIPTVTNVVVLIPVLCINGGVITACIVYMGWLEWKLLLAVLVIMVIGIVAYQLAAVKADKHFIRARQHGNRLQGHFQALIHGIKELKLHQRRREAFLDSALSSTAEAARAENVAAMTIYSIAATWGQLLLFAGLGFVVFYLGAAVGARGAILSGFAFAMLYLMAPLQGIMNSIPTMARASVAIGNVTEIGLKLSHSAKAVEQISITLPRESVYLELRNITYSYRTEPSLDGFTLGPIDLMIPPREITFITGGNGSGKTTLAKLILGLYIPDGGEIFYNGVLIDERNRSDFCECFSAIFSDLVLFESLFGLEGPKLDDHAREYLSRLRIDHKVAIQDGVLSTTELSHGQRKRLALLTACLEDRPVFVFDEWAADQDPIFKEIFYLSILPELRARSKTVIVISHDDRYYHMADRIVSMESGRLFHGNCVSSSLS